MHIRFYILLLCLSAGCQPEFRAPKSDIHAYFPVREGMFNDFEVVRTSYTLAAPPQTKKYMVRHLIGAPFTDQTNQTIFPVSYLTFSNLVWSVDSVGAVWSTFDRIFGNENGQTIVKLAEPLSERNFWNGNAYNKSSDQQFRVVDADMGRQVGSFNFPKTIVIVRQNDSTLLSRKRYTEIYAEGVGLVQREITMINYCYSTDCKGQGVVQGGITETSTLKNYGK
jgi:hypothetical protein